MKKRIIEYYIDTDKKMTAIDTQPNTPGWLIAYLFCKYDNMIKLEMFDGYLLRNMIQDEINDTFLQIGAASMVSKYKFHQNFDEFTIECLKKCEIELVEL